MRSATATCISGLMRKESFTDGLIADGMNEYLLTDRWIGRLTRATSVYDAELISQYLVRIRYTTRVEGLKTRFAIHQRFSFPLLSEVREMGFVLSPDADSACGELMVAVPDRGKGYFSATVHDAEQYILHCSMLIYNADGCLVPYRTPAGRKFVSNLDLGDASLEQAIDEQSRRVLRLRLHVRNLLSSSKVMVGYSAIGLHETRAFEVTPDSPSVVSDLLLEDNPVLLAGDYVVGVTDDEGGMLANGIVRLEADRWKI